MSNRIDLRHAEGLDSGLHGQSATGSTRSRQWVDGAPAEQESAGKGKSSEITDLETYFFEKHERKNWNLAFSDRPVRLHLQLECT